MEPMEDNNESRTSKCRVSSQVLVAPLWKRDGDAAVIQRSLTFHIYAEGWHVTRESAFGLLFVVVLVCGCQNSDTDTRAVQASASRNADHTFTFTTPQGKVVVAGYQLKAGRQVGLGATDFKAIQRAPNAIGPLQPILFRCNFVPMGASTEYKGVGSVFRLECQNRACVGLGVYIVVGKDEGELQLWGPIDTCHIAKEGREVSVVALFGIPTDATIEHLTLFAGKQSLSVHKLVER
jgi:hypothetical protein